MIRLRQRIPTSQLVDDQGVLARPGWLLAGLCLAAGAKMIEPPLYLFYPPDAALFGAGWRVANFLSSSWALFLIVFMLVGGMLGDLHGRRRVLLVGLLVMLLSNFALLLTPNTLWHVFWRIIAGLAAAVVLPLTLAPIYVFFAGRQRAAAYALYLTVTGAALLLADTLARWISDWLTWPAVYLLPLVITVLAIFIVRRSLPESRTSQPQLTDAVLYSGWTIVLLGWLYGAFEVVLGHEWLQAVVVLFALTQVIGLGMLGWWRRRTHADPRRAPRVHVRHLTVLILSGAILQLTLLGFFSLTYYYFRVGRNFSVIEALLALVPIFIGMLLAIVLVVRYRARVQVRQVVALGLLAIVLSLGLAAVLAGRSFWLLVLPLAVFGLSILATKTIWTNAFFQILIDRYIGLNAGINSATLLVGGGLGSVLANELLTVFGQNAFIRQSDWMGLSAGALEIVFENISTSLSAGEAAGFANLEQYISTGLFTFYRQAFITGYQLTVAVLALLCLLNALLIFRGLYATLQYQPDEGPLEQADEAQAELPEGEPAASSPLKEEV